MKRKAQTNDDGVDESRQVRVTVLASEWGSSRRELSTINRDLAIQLAKFPEVEISFFLPKCSQEEKKVAHQEYNVYIVEAKPRLGYKQLDWLCFPPKDLKIDVVVGHGVELGKQANVIKEQRKCKCIQVVHTDPEELGMFKSYPSPISKGQEKHKTEVELCEDADLVVGVGPKLSEAFRSYLRSGQKDESVLDFTPGVFEEFKTLQHVPTERKQRIVLLFGAGEVEDFELKGFDIAAKAVAALQDTRLMFVGAPNEKQEEIKEWLTGCGVPAIRLRVRGFVQDRESLFRLFQEVDLVVMPSRTEGFGLTGLEALSAGLPVLVSHNSGFGQALSKVPLGSLFVVDSEDPTVWTTAIEKSWAKDRKCRLEEAEYVRNSYDKKYNWAEQTKHLIDKITSWYHARLQIRVDCDEMVVQKTARVSVPSNQPPTVATAGPQEEATDAVETQEVVQGTRVEPGTLETPRMEATSGSSRANGAAITSQGLLNVVKSKISCDLNPSTAEGEEFNGFIVYLVKVLKADIVGFTTGSLIVTVECTSLKILEELWEDYNTGYLNEMAQKFLVTKDVLKEFGLAEVKLKTTINEEEYRACRELLSKITDDPSNTQSFPETNGKIFPSAFKASELTEGVTEEHEVKKESNPRGINRNRRYCSTAASQPGAYKERSKLPRHDRKFVNRRQEIIDIKTNLSPEPENHCRCVLVHGAVGIGKTATAIEAANEIRDDNDNAAVVYINCSHVSSRDDLAEKISGQMCNFPSNASTSEVERRLINEKDLFIILLLDDFQYLDPLGNNGEANINPEIKRIDQTEGSKIKKFITKIIAASSKVKLLVTSSVYAVFPETCRKVITLNPLDKEASFELLKTTFSSETQLEKETAYRIAKICSGIPLALITLASLQDHPPDLLKMMENANQEEQFKHFITIPTVDESKKIDVCLDACFFRLDGNLQDTLISLTLFRGPFTTITATNVFPVNGIENAILQLARRSFLEKNKLGDPAAPCYYSLLTVQKLYCRNKAKEGRLQKVYDHAREHFINYFLTFLKDAFHKFLSLDAVEACALFRQEEENIMQLLDLFSSDAMTKEQTLRCIDVFNKVVELLAKMMGEKRFEVVFNMLRDKCKRLEDEKRLSKCLTSLGIKEAFSCFFSPHLYYEAGKKAIDLFMEADRIQRSCRMIKGNSRARCLAKYGRCVSIDGKFEEGKEKITKAIEICKGGVEKSSGVIMLGATYNDLAIVLSMEAAYHQKNGKSEIAKEIFEEAVSYRTDKVLPTYREKLGDHPFTATILNNLSQNYRALGKFEDAKQCSEEALTIRSQFLKEHKETALSLFEFALVLKETNELQEAKKHLEKCSEMQKKVLDENDKDLESTKKELKEVCKKLEERSKKLSTKVSGIPLAVYSMVCTKLNRKQVARFNDFRMLAEKVWLTMDEADLLDKKCDNPTDEIFKTWANKGEEATVGKLIEWLRMDDFNRVDVANVLEDWVNEEPSD